MDLLHHSAYIKIYDHQIRWTDLDFLMSRKSRIPTLFFSIFIFPFAWSGIARAHAFHFCMYTVASADLLWGRMVILINVFITELLWECLESLNCDRKVWMDDVCEFLCKSLINHHCYISQSIQRDHLSSLRERMFAGQ